jgi:cellulose biosynthesis protein BcsQ
MSAIAVVGAKDGTTKTATVVALADLFAAGGFDVVMIDLAPQGGLTRRHGIERAVDPQPSPSVSR